MALTKLTTNSIKDSEVKTADINALAVTEATLAADSITTAKILDGTVAAADLNATQDWSSKTITVADSAFNTTNFNIALLGFKMAVNDSITVFNLVDGVVDEFHSEDGADEGEGSNDTYCASSDWYINSTQPTGAALAISAGFSTTAITEPDTSVTATNPAVGSGTDGTFTVPTGATSVNIQAWGAGAGSAASMLGGGGGYAEGTLAVTASQVLYTVIGEGTTYGPDPATTSWGHFDTTAANDGGSEGASAAMPGAGLSGVFTAEIAASGDAAPLLPAVAIVAGGGGGTGYDGEGPNGGSGGGATGQAASPPSSPTGDGGEQSNADGGAAGGGSQTAGGQGGSPGGNPGVALSGGRGEGVTPTSNGAGGGGAGYYGGGGGEGNGGAGGGGSSYFSHPQITSGSTEEGGSPTPDKGGGITQPNYVSGTNEGKAGNNSEDGYTLITASAPASATTTNVVSNAFTAGSAPSTARIVVFQENVDTPTLNTDIIASVSRDGGTTFTTATLSDAGYVTGASGQRILTGSATVSGQPSGTAMRWKLALANNAVKIHGVSLSWA